MSQKKRQLSFLRLVPKSKKIDDGQSLDNAENTVLQPPEPVVDIITEPVAETVPEPLATEQLKEEQQKTEPVKSAKQRVDELKKNADVNKVKFVENATDTVPFSWHHTLKITNTKVKQTKIFKVLANAAEERAQMLPTISVDND